MSAGKQVLESQKPEKSNDVVQNRPLEDPFETTTPSNAVRNGVIGAANLTAIPGTSTQQAMNSALGSSPVGFTSPNDGHFIHSPPEGGILCAPSFNVHPNVYQQPRSCSASPMKRPSPSNVAPLTYSTTCGNNVVTGHSVPAMQHQVGAPYSCSRIPASHTRTISATSSGPGRVLPGSFTERTARGTMMPPQTTPTKAPKAAGSRPATHRRKRTSDEVDAIQYSPEKRVQY